MIQAESKHTDRLGGREKAPLMIKVRIEGSTAASLMVSKPKNIPMSTFCATLIEYGLEQWDAAQKVRQQAIKQSASLISEELQQLEESQQPEESKELEESQESEESDQKEESED